MIVCTAKYLRYLDFFAQVCSFSDLAVLLHVCLTLSFICKHQIVGLVDLQLLIAPKPICVALLGLITVAVSEHRHVPLRPDARIEQLILHHFVHLLNICELGSLRSDGGDFPTLPCYNYVGVPLFEPAPSTKPGSTVLVQVG